MAVYSCVQRGVITVTDGDVSPKDTVLASSVKLGTTVIHSTVSDARRFDDVTDLQFHGATLRMLNANTLRMEWQGTLATDPITGGVDVIAVAYEVCDVESIGDDVKEILFRLQRTLGYLGENLIQDLIVMDDAGHIVQYRARVFDTKAHAQAATLDIADASALELGEAARCTMTQDIVLASNDRNSLAKVQDKLLSPTPGVD